jgi:DNA-nicking Smr family endonuclease
MTRRRRRPVLTEDDVRVWRHVAASVHPRPGRTLPGEADPPPAGPTMQPEPSAPAVVAAIQAPPVPAAAPASNSQSKKLPPLAGIETKLRQRVARGQLQIEARLDLHGHYQDAAHRRLFAFLREAQRRDYRLVLVITGKGFAGGGSDPETGFERERGVLRRATPLWLSAPEARKLVIGFEEAALHHGGSGALYVRIRRASE